MSKIRIVTDSDASLPEDIVQKLGIIVVPINIHFGEETLRTEIDITDVQLFERVDRTGQLPTTSAPSPGQFSDAFTQAFAEGAESVICINVSSIISGTYNAALNAQQLLPDKDITVIDSQSVSMGQGYMVIAAVHAAEAGLNKEAVIEAAESIKQRTTLYAGLSTLKYLAMSGRVGHLAAGMAGLLNIKPILTIREGKLDMLEKIRTQKKAWARLIELTQQALVGKQVADMAILHVDALTDAQNFERLLRERIDCPEKIIIADFTAGLSVHTGKGMIGVVAVAEE